MEAAQLAMVLRHSACIAIGILVATTAMVPPLGMAFGASSMAAGVLLASVAWIVTWALINKREGWPAPYTGERFLYTFTAFAFLLIQGVLCWWVFDAFSLQRFWQSILVLMICGSAAFVFMRLFTRLAWCQLNTIIHTVLFGLLIIGLFGLLGYSPFFPQAKSVFVFSEPSHFALSFLPFFFYVVVVSNQSKKLLWLSLGFLLALGLQNLTLLVGISIVALVTISLRHMLIAVPIALAFALVLDGHYYLERLDIINGKQNLSVLVFQQGWERAYLNLVESKGVGVGFQQFGVVGQQGVIPEEIQALYQKLTNTTDAVALNVLDGGSMAPKFIGEFGIFGLMLLLAYFALFFRAVRLLRRFSLDRTLPCEPSSIFFAVCFVMYVVDLFIRSVGYFSPSSFLFLSATLALLRIPVKSTGALPSHLTAWH